VYILWNAYLNVTIIAYGKFTVMLKQSKCIDVDFIEDTWFLGTGRQGSGNNDNLTLTPAGDTCRLLAGA